MKLYTKTICPKCIGVKSKIEEEGISVEIVNIDHDATAKQKLLDNGIMAVPVLEVDGELITDLKAIHEAIEANDLL